MRPTIVRTSFGQVSLERLSAQVGPAADRRAQLLFKVSEGDAVLKANGRPAEITNAQAAALNAMETVTRQPASDKSSITLLLAANADWLVNVLDRPTAPCGRIFKSPILPVAGIVKMCRDVIVVGMRMPTFIRTPLLEHQMTVLFRFAAARCGLTVADHLEQNAKNVDGRIRRIVDRLDQARGAPVSNEELAQSSGLSRTQFYENFKAATGLTPNQYRAMLRTEHAVALLCETEMSLSDVAFELQFDSQANFTRFMKTSTGITPKQFRRACHTLPG